MSNNSTPARNYPYPDFSDFACQFPLQEDEFAEAVNADMLALDVATKAQVFGPLVRMSLSTSTSFPLVTTVGITTPHVTISFDTVDVDTVGMTNLSRSAYGPFATVSGYYQVGCYLQIGPSQCTSGDGTFWAQFDNTSPQITSSVVTQQNVYDGSGGNQGSYLFLERLITVDPNAQPGQPQVPIAAVILNKVGTTFNVINGVNQANVQVVNAAYLWAYKVANL